ncbi:uncharacterized protein LOC132277673 [Cornus florida]|uniref:uncharacterized protein LOC132277673 n=1 Tax=Cornus florida TaxID=4283 RepID=UPI00289CBD85|nr:uncharacterized protein LOC132277673 [Cornus florida]
MMLRFGVHLREGSHHPSCLDGRGHQDQSHDDSSHHQLDGKNQSHGNDSNHHERDGGNQSRHDKEGERVAALEQHVQNLCQGMNQLVQQNAAIMRHLVIPATPVVKGNDDNDRVGHNQAGGRRRNLRASMPCYPRRDISGARTPRPWQRDVSDAMPHRRWDVSDAGERIEATHIDQQIQDLKLKVEAMAQALKGKGPATVDDFVQKIDLPFNPRVMALPLPRKFKMPHLESFDRTHDPLDHLETFNSLINMQVVPNEIICRMFPTTLKRSARVWFNKLKLRSISNFDELSKQFIGHFIAKRRHRKLTTYLLNVRQNKGETLSDYIGRFNTEMLQVDEVDDKVTFTAFI